MNSTNDLRLHSASLTKIGNSTALLLRKAFLPCLGNPVIGQYLEVCYLENEKMIIIRPRMVLAGSHEAIHDYEPVKVIKAGQTPAITIRKSWMKSLGYLEENQKVEIHLLKDGIVFGEKPTNSLLDLPKSEDCSQSNFKRTQCKT